MILIYTLIDYSDGSIAQSESLGSIMGCAEISMNYDATIKDMRLYVSEGSNNDMDHVVTTGKVLDAGYQLAMYHIFISVIRQTAKGYGIIDQSNIKPTLVYLRQKFQQYYK